MTKLSVTVPHLKDIGKKTQTCIELYSQDHLKTNFCLFQLMEQKRTRKVNLFDTSSSFLSVFMYTTLGILTGLLMTGTLWQILRNNCKTEINNNIISGKCAAVHKKRTRSMASALNSRSRGPPEWRNRVTVWFSWEGLFTLSTKEYEWESVRFQGILTKWLRKTFLWQHATETS